MTAGELIARVDALRPNQYSAEEKLEWLRRIDGQILRELERTHGEAAPAEPGELAPYTEATELRVSFPYDEELYSAWLFSQIDLHNGETARYNQSMSLLAAAWRQAADSVNRSLPPRGARAWRL